MSQWWWDGVIDDAYITYRYSENLVDGLGPVFNPGERLEGYSNPSWMLLMAGAIAAGLDPAAASRVLGFAAGAGLLLALAFALRRSGSSGLGAGLAALLLASSPILQMAAVSGLETVAYALLLFGGAALLCRSTGSPRTALAASACLAGAALTRPEGLAFWGAGLVCAFFWPGRDDSRVRRLMAYAAPGVAVAAHLLWRIAYYGSPVPNTYYAKTGGGSDMLRVALAELGELLSNASHVIWIALAIVGAWIAWRRGKQRRSVVVMAGAAGMQLFYVMSVGGDYVFVHRFYVPLLAPLAFLVGMLFVESAAGPLPRARRLGALAVAGTVLLGTWYARSVYVPEYEGVKEYIGGNIKLGRYLAEHHGPDTVVATAAAGAIPFYSGLPTIDIFGLNDAHTARVPFPDVPVAGLMKWDAVYVVARRPDVIVINRGYVLPGDPRAEAIRHAPEPLISHLMDVDLFREVLATGEYICHSVDLGDGSVFWIFELRE